MPQDFTLADPGPALLFDDRVYKRGALTLHHLRTTMGDTAFFSMVRAWTAAHRHGSVSTAAFLAHAPSELEPLLSLLAVRQGAAPFSLTSSGSRTPMMDHIFRGALAERRRRRR
ncbi:hypothetical protein [Nonomuraea dietziae]|uniref:hypothetical protein n=1 Tax=Nonomuraea dietziae TaxID=65515 RepID=UPI0031D1D38A